MRHLRKKLVRAVAAVVVLVFAGMAAINAVTPASAASYTYTFEITAGGLKSHINNSLPMNEWAVWEVWFSTPEGSEPYVFDNLQSPILGDNGWATSVEFVDWGVGRSGDFAKFLDPPSVELTERAFITDNPNVDGFIIRGDIGRIMSNDAIFSFDLISDQILVSPLIFSLVIVAEQGCKFQTSPNTCRELFGSFGGKARTDFINPITLEGQLVAIPLPAALPLFGTGLGILGFMGWRRRRKAQAV